MYDDEELGAVEITYKLRGGVCLSGNAIGSEYHLVLQLDPRVDDSWIAYYLTTFKGKSRKLSRYETDKLLDRVKRLTPKLPIPSDMDVIADPPPPYIELSVKYGNSSIQMSWVDDSIYDDEDEPLHPTDQLINLIAEIEPLDYEGLDIKPFRWL